MDVSRICSHKHLLAYIAKSGAAKFNSYRRLKRLFLYSSEYYNTYLNRRMSRKDFELKIVDSLDRVGPPLADKPGLSVARASAGSGYGHTSTSL